MTPQSPTARSILRHLENEYPTLSRDSVNAIARLEACARDNAAHPDAADIARVFGHIIARLQADDALAQKAIDVRGHEWTQPPLAIDRDTWMDREEAIRFAAFEAGRQWSYPAEYDMGPVDAPRAQAPAPIVVTPPVPSPKAKRAHEARAAIVAEREAKQRNLARFLPPPGQRPAPLPVVAPFVPVYRRLRAAGQRMRASECPTAPIAVRGQMPMFQEGA